MIIQINKLKIKYQNVDKINYAINQILINFLKIDMLHLYLAEYKVSFFQYVKIFRMIKQFLKGKPLAYILKNIWILENNFYLNRHVLIPRPETEELILDSIQEINKYFGLNKSKIIIDLCTGSLVIGASLYSKLEKCNIMASDISKQALKVAKINNKLIAKNEINLIKSDLLKYYIKNNIKCDVLISNPPYVNYAKKDFIYNYEPKKAIFAKKQGLFFYEKIIQNLQIVCNKKSLVIFEIGYNQKNSIEKLIKMYLPNQTYLFKQDLNGKWRFLYIYCKFS